MHPLWVAIFPLRAGTLVHRGEDGPIHKARHARMFLLLVSPGFGRPAPQTGV